MNKWDVFISHAYEDKEDIARPLAKALQEFGIKVWFDEFCFKPGDNIRKTIDKGLSESKFGIIILSKVFIDKYWTNYELDGLFVKDSETQNNQIIPIWHKITKSDLIKHSPSIVMRYALDTSKDKLRDIVYSVIKTINPKLSKEVNRRKYLLEHKDDFTQLSKVGDNLVIECPILRQKLPSNLVSRLTLLYIIMAKYVGFDYNTWIEGFMRDYDPNYEAFCWERITILFTQAWGKDKFNEEECKILLKYCIQFLQFGGNERIIFLKTIEVKYCNSIINGMGMFYKMNEFEDHKNSDFDEQAMNNLYDQ